MDKTTKFDGVPPGPSSIENDAHNIEKLLLKTQVSLTSFLHSEVTQIIQHIWVITVAKNEENVKVLKSTTRVLNFLIKIQNYKRKDRFVLQMPRIRPQG